MDVRTNCRCCVAACGVVIGVENDRVVSVRGDGDHPISRGYTCAKGRALPEFHHRADRLDEPTMAGVATDWSACLDDLAESLTGAIGTAGPSGVGAYFASGADTLGKRTVRSFLRVIGSDSLYSAATVDVAPALRAADLVTGSMELSPVWEPEDPDSRFVLYLGSNPVVSHGYLTILADPIRRIRAFAQRGGHVWVADPRATETSTLGEHLPIAPGSDPVLLAWLIRELLVSGADHRDLEAMTTPKDRQAMEAAVAPFTRDIAARITGVDAARLDLLLEDIRRVGRIAEVAGTGVTFGRDALVTEWLRWVLLIITGSLDRPGGMWFSPGWIDPLDERATWTWSPPEGDTAARARSRPELARLGGQMPSAAMVDEIEAGHLRALLVIGGSPLTAFPDPERLTAALRSLDLLAVVDVVETPLTKIATHVLPAEAMLERDELVTINRVSYAPRVVATAAQRKPSWWILAQIARRLGHDLLDGSDPDTTTDAELIANIVRSRPGAAEALFAAGPKGMDLPRHYGWVRAGALPDGHWRLAPAVLLERLPAILSDRTADLATARPLRLVSRRQVRATNATHYVPADRSTDTASLLVHPDDAARLGLAEGSEVALESDAGRIEAMTVELDGRLRPGSVSAVHGWHSKNVTHLTSSLELDWMTGQPQMSDIAVTIHPMASTGAHSTTGSEHG